jgi:putative ABC transport system permease protein
MLDLRALFRKRRLEAELDEELRFHLEKQIEQNEASGMRAEEARYAALRQFGNVSALKEECRDSFGARLINELGQDIRYGLRQLRRNPGFTAVAVITLALGIGANTAIFSVVNAVVLRPLPIYRPDRVVVVHDRATQLGLPSIPVSAPDFVDLSRRKDIFARTAVLSGSSFDLPGSGRPERLKGMLVTGEFFPLLGVKPLLGRWLLPSEDHPGANHVAVISQGLWERAFGSNPHLVGHDITLNGENYVVVGIMPASFRLPTMQTDVWSPLALTPSQLDPVKERSHQWLYMIARLQPGITLRAAQAAMSGEARLFMREYPQDFPPKVGYGINAVPLTNDLIGNTSKYLFVLLAAVGFVLLIACTNIANLMLGRAAVRSKETAIRAALGASRARIVRQLLTESLLLALGGGLAGLGLAVWGLGGLKAIAGGNIPRLARAGIDGHVLLFTTAVALLAGILFGLAPALRAARPDLHGSLKEGGRSGSAGARRDRVRSLLVISEVSLTLVLLAGGVLMMKSLARLLDVNPGFDPHHVLTLRISLPATQYSAKSRVASFYDSVLSGVSSLPGVEAAGAVDVLPMSGMTNSGSFRIEGRPYTLSTIMPHADVRGVMPGLFRALRVPLVEGRTFTDADNSTAPKVAIVDSLLAHVYWPKEDPLGQRVMYPLGSDAKSGSWYRVIGIVGNVGNRGFGAARKGVLYLPEGQRTYSNMSLVIRTRTDPQEIANEVRHVVSSVDSQQPVYDVKTMGEYVSESVSNRSLDVFLLAIFGALALALAAVGIYGVISYEVTRRTQEIGLRMALGARQSDVLRLVLRKGMELALIGVGIGIAAALGLTRLIASLLYGVKPTDPLTFVVVSLILIAVALVACYIPARRAAKVDPMVALRYE